MLSKLRPRKPHCWSCYFTCN